MNPRRVYSSYIIIYIYILILETWLPAIVIVFNDHERRLSIYSSRRHKRNCRYNGCPFSLFIRQQKYFSCSSPCEDRSPTIVEVNKEQCNLVFLGISRPFLPPNRGDRDVSLSRSRLPGRTGGIARAEPTVFNHPSSFFSSFKIFFRYVAQRALLIVNIVDKCFEAFQEDNGWLIVNWIESNRSRDGNSWVYKKNKHSPPVESFVKIKFDPISG